MNIINCVLGVIGFGIGIYVDNLPMALFALASALGWGKAWYIEKP